MLFGRELLLKSLKDYERNPGRRVHAESLYPVGKLCNLTCSHCHVNAGPGRKSVMARETIDRVVSWLDRTGIPTVGGALE